MKKIILALGLLSIGTANAANIDLAKSIVKAKCHLCHGEEGEASSAIYPRLAGQNRNQILPTERVV